MLEINRMYSTCIRRHQNSQEIFNQQNSQDRYSMGPQNVYGDNTGKQTQTLAHTIHKRNNAEINFAHLLPSGQEDPRSLAEKQKSTGTRFQEDALRTEMGIKQDTYVHTPWIQTMTPRFLPSPSTTEPVFHAGLVESIHA
jgi:hypothetical protein